MAAECGGGEETTITITPTGSAPGTPRSKVKFLCSHGGKILPRPSDGQLKYVGGETRVVSFSRDINFSDLMKKLASLSDGDIVLKYQLIPEDLDALVSVKSDEDLRHMLDEYDRHENAATPKFRAFLFPATPIVVENQMSSIDAEQHYIDAVNGIVRSTKHSSLTGVPPLSISGCPTSSGGSSPKSTDSSYTLDQTNHEQLSQSSLDHLHRVQSSPSISSLSIQIPNRHLFHHHHHHHQHHHHQQSYQQQLQHQQQQQQHNRYQSRRARTPEKPLSVSPMGRADPWKYQGIPSPTSHYPTQMNKERKGGEGGRCNSSK